MRGIACLQLGIVFLLLHGVVYGDISSESEEDIGPSGEQGTDGSSSIEEPENPGDVSKPAVTPDNNELLELCKNAQKGIIPYPNDPHHFVVCLVNPPTLGDCKPLCFDKTDNTCKGCPPNSLLCTGKDMLSIVKSDCHQYYICMGGGRSLAIECPSNQHYSEAEKKCVPAIDADCLPFNSWCKNQPDGLRFESKNCYEYYECQKEQIFLKTCNYNEYFHKANSSCVPGFCAPSDGNLVEREPICTQAMEGMKSTHPKCYKYYVCLNKLAYVGQCPTGYYFNATAKKCVIDTNEVCNDD